MAGIIIIFIFI